LLGVQRVEQVTAVIKEIIQRLTGGAEEVREGEVAGQASSTELIGTEGRSREIKERTKWEEIEKAKMAKKKARKKAEEIEERRKQEEIEKAQMADEEARKQAEKREKVMEVVRKVEEREKVEEEMRKGDEVKGEKMGGDGDKT
jgi:hypothetical protein